MATVESITKRLDGLEGDRNYLTIEEVLLALERETPDESAVEILQRLYPLKKLHPTAMADLLNPDGLEGDQGA